MANLNICEPSEKYEGCWKLPEGRMNYCYLAKPAPNVERGDGEPRYQTSILIPPGADLKPLKMAMLKIAKEHIKDENKAKKAVQARFINPRDLPQGKDMGEQWEGFTLIRTSASKYRPSCVDARGREVDLTKEGAEEEAYSGRWARLLVKPAYYPARKGGGEGMTLYTSAVQLLQDDDRIGGAGVRASDAFEAVEDEDVDHLDDGDDDDIGGFDD